MDSQFTVTECKTAITTLKSALTGTVVSYTLPNGMQIQKMSHGEMRRQLSFYNNELARLENEERLDLGLGSKRKIRVRF